MRISRKATFLEVIVLVVILSYISFVSAETRESCSCGCTQWNSVIDHNLDNNLAKYCISKYLPANSPTSLVPFIYGYDSAIDSSIRNCREIFTYHPGSLNSVCSGCCNGKCFDINTEKCCKNFYMNPGSSAPIGWPDDSGLICNKTDTCADENGDGISDKCLGYQPVPSCLSMQELGSCKICDVSTGVVSNIPSGASYGSCSGQDSENQCSELRCDGNGGCVSVPVPSACPNVFSAKLSANVGDLVIGDYTKLKDLMDEVSYSQVFPPKLFCTASIGALNLRGEFIQSAENANLKFDFVNSGTGEIFYSQSLDCQGECSLDLPEENAKKIKPSENIYCQATKDSESQKSNLIIIPDFYLYIKKIKAFNVFEDFPLVAGKPFGISVYAYFRSRIITNLDIEVPVRLKYTYSGKPEIQINFKPMKEFNLEEIKNRVRQNPENPNLRDIQILEKAKKAEDSANFFQLPAPSEGKIEVSAEINPQSVIDESFGGADNYRIEAFPVVSTRKLRILPVNVLIRDMDKVYVLQNGAMRPIYVIRDYSISPNQAGSEYVAREAVSRGMGVVETLYPIAKSNVEILPAVTVTINRATDSSKGLYTLSDGKYILSSEVINPIYSQLLSEAKKYRADYAFGIAPGRLLAAEGGSNKGVSDISSGKVALFAGFDCPGNKSQYPGNEVALRAISYETFAHELAHLNGISAGSKWTEIIPGSNADYPVSMWGIGASKGWIIDQTTGKAIAPMMNIWVNPGESVNKERTLFDKLVSGENIYPKTEIRGSSGIFLNLDLLKVYGQGNLFVYREQYQKLLDNYRGNSFKYPSMTGAVVKPIIAPSAPVPTPASRYPIINTSVPAIIKNTSTTLINPQIPISELTR